MEYNKFDLNGDGIVDQKDLDIITQMWKGEIPSTAQADFNNDGEVTVSDVASLSNYIHYPPYEAKYDLNNDGVIDQSDLDIVAQIVSGLITDPALVAQADFNGDGKVTSLEITMISQRMGTTRPEGSHTFRNAAIIGIVLFGIVFLGRKK